MSDTTDVRIVLLLPPGTAIRMASAEPLYRCRDHGELPHAATMVENRGQADSRRVCRLTEFEGGCCGIPVEEVPPGPPTLTLSHGVTAPVQE